MTTKSRQSIYGASIQAAAERAQEARKEADRLACDAWNKAHGRLSWACAAFTCNGRRAERGLPLSRSAVPRMRHAPDRCARCGPQAEDDTDPRA